MKSPKVVPLITTVNLELLIASTNDNLRIILLTQEDHLKKTL